MSNFFDKLGRTLKLEDEQEASLAYADEQEADELSDDDEVMEKLEKIDLPQTEEVEVDEDMLDEEMLKEISDSESIADDSNSEDAETEFKATLAAAPQKTAKSRRVKPKQAKKSSSNTSYPQSQKEGRLNIDVYELDDEIVIKSAIAGINDEDLDIEITPDSVVIRGQRQQDEEVSEEDYFYKECYWGAFSRSVRLHTEINPDKAEAILNNGILTVRLPKLSTSQQKKLKVRKVG